LQEKINMEKFNLKELIENRYPGFMKYPALLRRLFVLAAEKTMRSADINKFLEKNSEVRGMAFIDEIFDFLNFSFYVSHKDSQKIPSEGKVVLVANHPIGSLDGLALLRAVYNIRRDVKIVANDILMQIDNLRELFLPYNIEKISAQKQNIRAIQAALENEEAVIIFPAAEVSRLRGIRIVDKRWNKGPVYFARKFNAPILPVFVKARNSAFFYLFSAINKPVSRLLLPRELFNKKNKTIKFVIGEPIPAKVFAAGYIDDRIQIKLLKKHVYDIGKNRQGVFLTEKNIIHPVEKKILKKELDSSELLGITPDQKKIILADMENAPNVMKEIARLREITFRRVGEGTGRKLDIDSYDRYYKHIVVWDEKELEIVGSYRVGIGREITENFGAAGFYTSTLFEYSMPFEVKLSETVELGRSFVQKKYWNTNALHYLWLGIGAFLAKYNEVKYLFGGVSLSASYPENIRKMIVFYFRKWFPAETEMVRAKNIFSIDKVAEKELDAIFIGKNRKEDYNILKNQLRPFGLTVPVLYKHYTELGEDGGVKFLAFGVDPDFENCIDGLIFIQLNQLKKEKWEKYIQPFLPNPVEKTRLELIA